MKILRIIARLNVGGPARHVVSLTKGLNDVEFRSTLIAGRVPAGEEDMSYLADETGVRPLFVDAMSRELSLWDVVSLLKIYREMRRLKPDIVHTHTAKSGTVGRAAAFLYRWGTWSTLIGRPRTIRIVHTFHGHVFHSYYGKLKTRVFVAIEKVLARFATDLIIVISPQQLGEIHGEFGIGRASQFRTIPLGIELELYRGAAEKRRQSRSELGIADDDLLVGFVGRITEVKNISLFLQAAEIITKRTSSDGLPHVRFIIAGDGHLRPRLEAEAVERGISTYVEFLGNRTDVDRIYAALDIVALTSLNEGTPLSLIEAMATGRAVISTRVGGTIDLLGAAKEEHQGFAVHERGVGVDAGSAESFANGLIYLLEREKLRKDLAESGKKFVEEKYHTDRLLDDFRGLYRELNGSGGD